MATIKRVAKRRNVAAGYVDGTGFHPIRSSADYDAGRLSTNRTAKGRKKKAASKLKGKASTDGGGLKYRKTTRKGKTVYVSTSTGRIVKGPGAKKAAPKKRATAKKVVKKTKRNPPYTVTTPTTRHKASEYAQAGLTKQEAWDKFIGWARSRTLAMPLPGDSIKRQRIKVAFMKEYDRTKGLVKNPKTSTKTYKLVWSPTGQKIGTVAASSMQAAIRKAPAPYSKYKGEIYAEEISKNPKRGVAQTHTAVGKSAYKATMDKAKALMPFPGAKVLKQGPNYYLAVPGKNAAMARSILNAMAKEMTKK